MKSFLFLENNLSSSNQSYFKTRESCNNQLLSITHNIYQSFHESYEIRVDILDISKSFEKVRDKGIIFKLFQNGISGKLLKLVTDFLKN